MKTNTLFALLTFALFTQVPFSGRAQETTEQSVADWSYEPDQDGAQIGFEIAAIGDINNDGINDLVASSKSYIVNDVNGAVFLFLGTENGFSDTPDQIIPSPVSSAEFGTAIDIVPDMNGDGFGELAVGAPFHDIQNGINDGILYVFFGAADGVNANSPWTHTSGGTQRQLGAEICSGDFNNDGYGDLAVARIGLYWTNSQRLIMIYGSANGPGNIVNLDIPGWESLGLSMDAGDINDDGFDDLLVGSPHYGSRQSEDREGKITIYSGSPSGLVTSTAAWEFETNALNFQIGTMVSIVGDVNGDTYPDFASTAIGYSNGEEYEGAVYLFSGASALSNCAQEELFESNQEYQSFGKSIAGGDVDNDGYADLLIGNTTSSQFEDRAGIAMLYKGSAGGISTDTAWTTSILSPAARLGHAAVISDVNNDSFDDIIISSISMNGSGTDRGHVFAYYSDMGAFSEALSVTERSGHGSATVVYPNPLSGEHIHLNSASKERPIQVFLSDGSAEPVLLESSRESNSTAQLKLPADLPAGMYFLRIVFENRTETQKVVIH